MAKKVNDVKDGDLKSNVVVLRSVYGKVGQKYFIQPQRDPKTGRFPKCVKQVNSYGDIILTEDERNREAQGLEHFIPVTEVFTITDGKSFNLDDIYNNQSVMFSALGAPRSVRLFNNLIPIRMKEPYSPICRSD